MADYMSDDSSHSSIVSSTPEQIEREQFQRDFIEFTTYLTPEDWAKIYKCIDILQESMSIRDTSSVDSTCELSSARQTEDVNTWPVTQNTRNFAWSATQIPMSCHQSDIPPKTERRGSMDAHQLQILEEVFSSAQYIIGKKRQALAEHLGVSEKQVSHWFERRRRLMREEQSETNGVMKFVPATSSHRQSKRVGAHLVVKQESVNTGYVCSANLLTEKDVTGKKYNLMSDLNSENACPNVRGLPTLQHKPLFYQK